MKYRTMSLLIFFICLFTIGIVRANTLPLLGKVIYIDPGHGGADPGAIWGNLDEADINLEISLKLEKILSTNGAIVYLTRYGDYDLSTVNAIQRKQSDLSRRANIINRSSADLYLSIHLNADISDKWYGAQVFYDSIVSKNEEIAKIIQEQLQEDINTKREHKQIKNQYMYKRIMVPGVLIEAGFITNSNERYLLKQDEYQEKLAASIQKGVIKYFTN